MNDNADEDTKTTEAPSLAPSAPASDSRTLRVSAPAWCTTMNFPQDDGSTLVIDRKGVSVAATVADTLIETAAKHGVTITEVSI